MGNVELIELDSLAGAENSKETRNICIPIEDQPLGGMYTFLRSWRTYLERSGIHVTSQPNQQTQVLFVNSWRVPYRYVKRAKRRLPNLRVVQRADGAGRDYGRTDDADARQARVNTLADLTIFQSRYGKYATTQKYRVLAQDGPVIYNPVDTDLFRPNGDRLDLPGRTKVCYVTFSTNPRKGTPELYEVIRCNPDVDFILIGKYEAPPPLPNVHPRGVLDRVSVSQVLRSCDVYVTFSENDTCPNTVLEALASGVPVLFKESGGVAELVGPCGAGVTVATFRAALHALLAKREELARGARQRAETHFAPDVIFPQYLAAIERAERRPIPGLAHLVRLHRRGYPVLFSPLAAAKRLAAGARRGAVRSLFT